MIKEGKEFFSEIFFHYTGFKQSDWLSKTISTNQNA